ncbi:MAG TPA: hypothetical protein PLR22_03085 [Saprospiraceae bacterium]|nr:hypothetical protein [Saprospiraceae bacterium]
MYAILGDYAYALAVFFFSISTSIPDLRLRPNSRCPYGFLNPLKKQGKDRPLTLDALAHWMLGSYNVTQNRVGIISLCHKVQHMYGPVVLYKIGLRYLTIGHNPFSSKSIVLLLLLRL